ncbi:MAG: D-alanine--D-alanine ligase [Opitutales bacterium]|nr:D-alanine--D-alanine ligase [Opitutales bacterium]
MKPKIAVLCGGISPERDVSIISGQNVFEALSGSFDAKLVRLDENKLPGGLDPRDTIIYPAMHGDYGEDGTLQAELDEAGFSYAGCGALASRVCMAKPAAKALLKFAGLPVAKSLEFSARNKPSAETLFSLFPNGSIIKPADKGSSVGLVVARDMQSAADGLKQISSGEWMAEEFLKGREFSIGVIYGKAAGVVEIKPDGGVYDFKRKYTAGSTVYEFPAKISKVAEDAMRAAAEKAYVACGCRDFSRVDFIMTSESDLKFAILEINTLPGMTPTSLLPKSASCVGYDFKSLCAKLLEGAIKRFEK